jgi:hypothetical protein
MSHFGLRIYLLEIFCHLIIEEEKAVHQLDDVNSNEIMELVMKLVV